MKQDFTALQYIDIPANLEMISGPVSYDKYSIYNNNQVLKEIQIFGDMHFSESNNCTEQGEKCIYVTKDGIIHDGTKEEVNCVDIPTYLGYAILDAHTQRKYTDIYIEASQAEVDRLYNIEREDPTWDIGYLIKAQLFLQPCGTSINRHPLCRDGPNGERNWARVHSGDIRAGQEQRNFISELTENLKYDHFRDSIVRDKAIDVLSYLLENVDEFLVAFTEEDLGAAIRRIFLPFYDIIYPQQYKTTRSSLWDPISEIYEHKSNLWEQQLASKELYVKNNYPFIHILLRDLGGYYGTKSRLGIESTIFKHREHGSSLLKRTSEGKNVLIHRVGKTYSKVITLKNKYKEYEIPHIMIIAYEKFVTDMKLQTKFLIKTLITHIININPFVSNEELMKMKNDARLTLLLIFTPTYDIYTIGRMISYPESQRMIYFAGYAHCDMLRKYIEQYLNNEILRINNLYNTHYSIVHNAHSPLDTEHTDRCIR